MKSSKFPVIGLVTAAVAALVLSTGCAVLPGSGDGLAGDGSAVSANGAGGPDSFGVPPRPTRVAILLSDDVPTYRQIAELIVLRGQHNEYVSLNLGGEEALPAAAAAQFTAFDPDKIVAIGLLAAKAARGLSDRPMVFCQVFNYQDHQLLSSRSKGVKLLPPFARQIEVWKTLTPGLRSVGVIAGPNQKDLLAEISTAAAEQKVQLLVRTVTNDREALLAFKQLTPQVQGSWLLPDNRVLSPRVLREMLSYSNKHGTQTAVFDRQLLNLGADISFTSNQADIADAVLSVLGGSGSKNILFGPPMTSLKAVNTAVDAELFTAARAGGRAPEGLERYPSAN